MRVAVIAVGLVVVSTPSQASRSCMTQAEARQQSATSHLYWHGSGHCWDAMTPSRRVVHRVRENVQREAQRDPAEPDNSSHCGNGQTCCHWNFGRAIRFSDDLNVASKVENTLPSAIRR